MNDDNRCAIPAADALKYAAARLRYTNNWASDGISGSDCELGHDIELDAINRTEIELSALAAQYGDPRRYSDGRRVETYIEIADGLTMHHVWHPDPAAEPHQSWRGPLLHDPSKPSPGIYEVRTDPATQHAHVRVIRSA